MIDKVWMRVDGVHVNVSRPAVTIFLHWSTGRCEVFQIRKNTVRSSYQLLCLRQVDINITIQLHSFIEAESFSRYKNPQMENFFTGTKTLR